MEFLNSQDNEKSVLQFCRTNKNKNQDIPNDLGFLYEFEGKI